MNYSNFLISIFIIITNVVTMLSIQLLFIVCYIWSSHSSEDSSHGLLGSDTM